MQTEHTSKIRAVPVTAVIASRGGVTKRYVNVCVIDHGIPEPALGSLHEYFIPLPCYLIFENGREVSVDEIIGIEVEGGRWIETRKRCPHEEP